MSKLEIPLSAVKTAASDGDLRAVFPVIRVLRPHLSGPDAFIAQARRQMASCGWRLVYVEDAGVPVGCAGFRISEWLSWGKALYVDDLVVLESHRGRGYADALMGWMERLARAEGCAQFHLDSGTHRLPAHRFYHRLKLGVTAFHFQKTLSPD